MGLQEIQEIINLPYGIVALIVGAIIYAFKYLRDDTMKREEKYDSLVEENKKEAIQREDRLMEHIERYDNSLSELTTQVQGINSSLTNLSDKVDDLEQKIR